MPNDPFYAGGGIGLGPAVEELPPEPWPSPTIQAHIVEPDFMNKGAVKDLERAAWGNGWTVVVTHAQGSFPSTGKRPSKPRHSLAVHLFRRNSRAVAVYVESPGTWKWDTLYVWDDGKVPRKIKAITEFLTLIRR